MLKKVLWLLLVLVTVMALLLVSCKTETTTEEQGGTTTITGKITNTQAPPTIIPPETTRTEKPRYGGIITVAGTTDPSGFDDEIVDHYLTTSLNLTNDELLMGDWTKGPAGTGQTTFTIGGNNTMDLLTGALADTWQIPSRGKIIFHIREGVHWHNKPPTNGRELTVDDVVYTLNRIFTTKTSYVSIAFPNLCKTAVVTGDNAARTVTIECPPGEWSNLIMWIPNYYSIFPKDALELWGNMNDWKHSIGTGPFIFTDFVSAGSLTFIRNPNFWEKNPIGPGKGDQLPYVEGVKILIVPDSATYWAAFRTGKIDGASGSYTDVKEFLPNPDIKYTQYLSDVIFVLYMRTDKADSPFSKLAVRQALTMGIDYNKIVNEYYEGHATLLAWPIAPIKETAGAWIPFNELPTETQALFSHNVTKAKELLTQAGYPTGFSCKVTVYNAPAYTDYLSQYIKMWAEIGVTLTLDAKDYVTWLTRARSRNYDDLLNEYTAGNWRAMLNFTGTNQWNGSYVNDPVINTALEKSKDLVGVDDAALKANFKTIYTYAINQCWVIPAPSWWYYVVWWPWVKNWNGELYVGFYSYPLYMRYRWCDVDIKKQMTGK